MTHRLSEQPTNHDRNYVSVPLGQAEYTRLKSLHVCNMLLCIMFLTVSYCVTQNG